MGCTEKKSDHYVILFFSLLTLIFNTLLLYLHCIPKFPDKVILVLSILVTSILVIFIPIKINEMQKNEEIPLYLKDILDISHWGYVIVVPLGILVARSVPVILLMLCVSWFAIIGRAIFGECPLTSIAEKSTQFNTEDGLVNLFFTICVVIASIRLIIN